jgi:hypothetical protein
MKPFTVNRNSWHYKLNKHFLNEDGFFMERSWEPKHNNFCSYWRATMFRMAAVGLLATGIIILLSLAAVGTYVNPLGAAIVVGVILAMIAGVALLVVALHYADKRKYANRGKPESLFMQKYKAHKSKICPSVEFDA